MSSEHRTIVGITGRLASGKGRMTQEILKRYDAEYIKFSNSLRDLLDLYLIPQSRDNIDQLSTFLRRTYGEDVLARAVEKKALASPHDVVIIDGIRRKTDFDCFKKNLYFSLVYIDVKPEIRFERSRNRNENVGDANLSYEQFLAQDSGEPQQEIESLKSVAHYVIDNNGSEENFNRIIDETIKKILGK